MALGDVLSKLETFVWIWNHVSTKPGQVPNLKLVFCVVASIYKLDKIYNLTHSPVQPQSGLYHAPQIW